MEQLRVPRRVQARPVAAEQAMAERAAVRRQQQDAAPGSQRLATGAQDGLGADEVLDHVIHHDRLVRAAEVEGTIEIERAVTDGRSLERASQLGRAIDAGEIGVAVALERPEEVAASAAELEDGLLARRQELREPPDLHRGLDVLEPRHQRDAVRAGRRGMGTVVARVVAGERGGARRRHLRDQTAGRAGVEIGDHRKAVLVVTYAPVHLDRERGAADRALQGGLPVQYPTSVLVSNGRLYPEPGGLSGVFGTGSRTG